MVRWVSAPKPAEAVPSSGRRYRRGDAYNFLYQGLADRPASEHAAFLVEFAERYPQYPAKPVLCPCTTCLIKRHTPPEVDPPWFTKENPHD